jgi:hypothetical protein
LTLFSANQAMSSFHAPALLPSADKNFPLRRLIFSTQECV